MLGVSRKLVEKRWRIPILASWVKLFAVAWGLARFLAHLGPGPAGTWLEFLVPSCCVASGDWIEAWGLSLLTFVAVLSIVRMRRERRRGLSPSERGVFWACIMGVECIGAAAWGVAVWTEALLGCIPIG